MFRTYLCLNLIYCCVANLPWKFWQLITGDKRVLLSFCKAIFQIGYIRIKGHRYGVFLQNNLIVKKLFDIIGFQVHFCHFGYKGVLVIYTSLFFLMVKYLSYVLLMYSIMVNFGSSQYSYLLKCDIYFGILYCLHGILIYILSLDSQLLFLT